MTATVIEDLHLSWQLVYRNIAYQRTAWVAAVTAFVEPALYFLAVVAGFSQVVGGSAHRVYADFAGPALLAVCIMNGSIVECTNNVFYRWRLAKLYDSVVCTAMSPGHVVIGDAIYGTIRGALYGAIFLIILIPFLGISASSAAAMLVAAFPVGWLFSSIGLCLVSRVTKWRQLQLIQLAMFVMFMMADTFVNLSSFGTVLNVLVHLLPLTYASMLMRALAQQHWASALLLLVPIIAVNVAASALAVRTISRKMTA